MDVEFEEVEEGIVDEVDGAVYVLFDAEEEFEWAAGFVAGGEGDVGELAGGVLDVFACVAVVFVSYVFRDLFVVSLAYTLRLKQLTGILCPIL